MCQNTEGSAKFIYGWLDKYYNGKNGQERTFKRENQRYWILREREREAGIKNGLNLLKLNDWK